MCLGNSSFLGSAHRLHVVLIDVWRVVNAKGGAEKVFCDMANALASQGFEVSAICFDENKGQPGYPLDSSVRFINAHNDSSDSFFDKKFVEKMRAWSFNNTQRKINRFILKTRKYQEGIQRVLGRLKKVDIFISYQCETTFVLREFCKVRRNQANISSSVRHIVLYRSRQASLRPASISAMQGIRYRSRIMAQCCSKSGLAFSLATMPGAMS